MSNIKIILHRFYVWVILFSVGFIIYPIHDSNLIFFKTILIISGMLVSMFFLKLYFKKVNTDFVKAGIKVGIIWLAINIIFDLIFLVVMFETPLVEYFQGIGLRYINIPITSIGIGYILESFSGRVVVN